MKQQTLKKRLGIILINYRKYQNLSQVDIANKLNYSQSVISRMEQGYDEININLYLDAFKQLELQCDPSDELQQEIKVIIDTAFKQVIFLDEAGLKDSLKRFNRYMPNVLYYHDFLMFEAYDLFYDGNDSESFTTLHEIKGYEQVLHSKSLELYYYLQASVNLRKQKKNLVDSQQYSKYPLKHGIDYYIRGVYDYYSYNFSKALPHLLNASDYFIQENNTKRYGRVEVYINKILMKDNDYFNIKLRIESFLKHQPELIIRDQINLQFQLAYSLYHLKDYQKAYQLFQSITYDHFDYSDLMVYMMYKCEHKLGIKQLQPIDSVHENNFLIYLYHHYKDETKTKRYYKVIENYLIPTLSDNLEMKEYHIHILELLEYYFETKQYIRFKELSKTIDRIYHTI